MLVGALAAALLSGCAQSVDPIERLGEKAAQRVHHRRAPHERAYRRWRLPAPLAPAPRPNRSPGRVAEHLPAVLDRVPTRDRVVFLTYDEDAENDPRFVDMVRELRLPVSVFLADSAGPAAAAAARPAAPSAGRPAPGPGTGRRGRGTTLHPGDIVLTREGGRPPASLTAETARLLRRIQARGFTVGRLEDYL
ncbi:hypothetical protein ACWD5Q_07625 [Streptomyces sp. NPDC002513]